MMYFDLTEEERRKALDICDDIKRQCDEILELLDFSLTDNAEEFQYLVAFATTSSVNATRYWNSSALSVREKSSKLTQSNT